MAKSKLVERSHSVFVIAASAKGLEVPANAFAWCNKLALRQIGHRPRDARCAHRCISNPNGPLPWLDESKEGVNEASFAGAVRTHQGEVAIRVPCAVNSSWGEARLPAAIGLVAKRNAIEGDDFATQDGSVGGFRIGVMFETPFFEKTLVCLSFWACLLYTSPSPRDRTRSRMPSSA